MERVRGGWQTGVHFYADDLVTEVQPLDLLPVVPTIGAVDEDGLALVQQQIAQVLWGRWAAEEIPAIRIIEDPRTVAQVLGSVLAAHDAQVRAEAWDEGCAAGHDCTGSGMGGHCTVTNPYRPGADHA